MFFFKDECSDDEEESGGKGKGQGVSTDTNDDAPNDDAPNDDATDDDAPNDDATDDDDDSVTTFSSRASSMSDIVVETVSDESSSFDVYVAPLSDPKWKKLKAKGKTKRGEKRGKRFR